MATNISFGEYKTPPPPPGTIDIRIGVFFDGTMNNRTNTNSRLGKEGPDGAKAYKKYGKKNDSYANDWSNIARLETAYHEDVKKFIFKIYIEGIGTEDFDMDSSYFTKGSGGAFGAGTTGIIAKVLSACEKTVEIVDKIKRDNKINCLYFDVFGFSRGAAAARNFVYEITKDKYPSKNVWVYSTNTKSEGKFEKQDDHGNTTMLKELPRYGHLGLKLTEKHVDVKKLKLKTLFVGLFDTVSSYDPQTTGAFKDFNNDVEELQLNAINKAAKIFQLAADDEHRVNFMLTRVKAAGGSEYFLPGVHSDIGGSYVHDTADNVQLLDIDNTIFDGYSDEEWDKLLNNDLNNLINQAWFKKHEVVKPNKMHETFGNRPRISNRYSYVPLYIMAENANKFEGGLMKMDTLIEKYKIPDGKGDKIYPVDLTLVKRRLDDYIAGIKPKMLFFTIEQLEIYRKKLAEQKITVKEFNLMVNDHNMLMNLRNRYFHWSAKYGEAGLGPNFDYKDKFNIRRFRENAKNS